ncbi:elongation factor Ts, mitochondrial isoform X2 [Strigops habroptila]|uniref:elongation factor Ts, mitochondrial isoform X2 n=1 Tax=Strigops habroptila TaxID=2489341 RepID=UPI0011CF9F71|nr:elongation factor Ts, mitochondrial isoform X2 [Strigops habroptila]
MQRAARGALWALPARFFRAAAPVLAADKESLVQLRRRTGLPILQCRDALLRCGGDLAQAEVWLLEQARRQGWSSAPMARDRPAREGLVGLLREGPAAVMVELSCETDFVARTSEFQRVVVQAALGAMELCRRAPPAARACSQHFLQPEELAELRTGPGGGPLNEELALAQGRLGEAVSLRHAAWLRVRPGSGFVSGYAHGGPAADAGAGPVALGTLGALVACGARGVARGGARGPALEALGRQVAQHVVGFAPRRVGRAGRARGGRGGGGEEEEEALLAQEFLHAPGRCVARVLRARGPLRVTGFVRFRCGEEPTADVTSR